MAAEFLHWLAEESKLPGSFTPRGPREDAEAPGFASGYTMPAGAWWNETDCPAPEGAEGCREACRHRVGDPTGPTRHGHRPTIARAGRREQWATLTVNQRPTPRSSTTAGAVGKSHRRLARCRAWLSCCSSFRVPPNRARTPAGLGCRDHRNPPHRARRQAILVRPEDLSRLPTCSLGNRGIRRGSAGG
jgi:hypothetical protein